MLSAAIALTLAYVLGSVPTGLWLGLRLKEIDIREHGSHNIGATNTLRVLGKKWGGIALAGDMLKGVLAVTLVARLSPDWAYAPLACGLAAILGHLFSVFARLRGGKGVATSAGVFFALCPLPMTIALATFVVVVAATRMVSAGSCAGAVVLAASVWLPAGIALWPGNYVPDPLVLRALVATVAVFVLVKHRSNLGRILRGEENKLW